MRYLIARTKSRFGRWAWWHGYISIDRRIELEQDLIDYYRKPRGTRS